VNAIWVRAIGICYQFCGEWGGWGKKWEVVEVVVVVGVVGGRVRGAIWVGRWGPMLVEPAAAL
jgi:hypothetical protein